MTGGSAGSADGQYHSSSALSAAAMVAAATATATATASVVALQERQDMNGQFGQVSTTRHYTYLHFHSPSDPADMYRRR